MEINIKKALESLESLRVEKEENEKRIKYLRQRKEKLEAAGGSEVADTVKGNDGKHSILIRGTAWPEYDHVIKILTQREANLSNLNVKIEEQIKETEEIINMLTDSTIRRMLTYKYIDRLTWQQTALRMGRRYTADSCRKAVERFLK
jgi:hypothetical protein|nr:MAG TPA: Protein of unknown function (DUF1492) [Caudoviricetes sp.]